MTRTTAAEFQRNIGEFQHRAKNEPIEITRHGRREWVLLSADHYDWLIAARKRAFRTSELPKFVVDAVIQSDMDPRHAHLDKLMKS